MITNLLPAAVLMQLCTTTVDGFFPSYETRVETEERSEFEGAKLTWSAASVALHYKVDVKFGGFQAGMAGVIVDLAHPGGSGGEVASCYNSGEPLVQDGRDAISCEFGEKFARVNLTLTKSKGRLLNGSRLILSVSDYYFGVVETNAPGTLLNFV